MRYISGKEPNKGTLQKPLSLFTTGLSLFYGKPILKVSLSIPILDVLSVELYSKTKSERNQSWVTFIERLNCIPKANLTVSSITVYNYVLVQEKCNYGAIGSGKEIVPSLIESLVSYIAIFGQLSVVCMVNLL